MPLTEAEAKELESLETELKAKKVSSENVVPDSLKVDPRRRALQSLPRSLASGTGFQRAPNTGGLEDIEKGAYELGGAVTDATGSPALGTAVRMVPDIAATAIGGVPGVAPMMRSAAENVMQRAIKPSLGELKSGDAAIAIDTMLNEGLNATKGGVKALREKIGELNDQIKTAIENSPAYIKTGNVGKGLMDTMKRFQEQVNPQTDIETIKNAWAMFKNHPLINGASEIPIQLAQDLKTGTQQMLRKKYGQMGTADIEAQKGMARGLREEISSEGPSVVAGLNAEESKLITTLNVVEKRALLDLNKDMGGLAWLSHRPELFAAYMADKSALFKSLVARMLNANQNTAGPAAAAGAVAAYESRQHGGPVNPGQPYLVGEKGPEVIVPQQSGFVIPRLPNGEPAGNPEWVQYMKATAEEQQRQRLMEEAMRRYLDSGLGVRG